MTTEEQIKLFGLSNVLAERELGKIERSLMLELQRVPQDDKDEEYYPQFNQKLRLEAAKMGQHYELFYCLEKSIRHLIAEALQSSQGEKWWDVCVPATVKENVKANMQREIDSGVTSRSDREIDFTTFGELGEIVRNNWACFDTMFASQKAFTKIMTSLNQLRGPIAHCCPLAEDEVVRLQLTVRDWFRLME